MDELIPAASALIIHKGKILFVRSNTTQEQWAFPGGKQEKNETPKRTARREIEEELGLDINIKGVLGSYIHASKNQRFAIRCFIAESNKFDLRENTDEIIEAKWCTFKEGLALNLTSTTREALKEFSSKYSSHLTC
jgi:ADP-ribose pyrophosphatase YjhB (NUDIX family)